MLFYKSMKNQKNKSIPSRFNKSSLNTCKANLRLSHFKTLLLILIASLTLLPPSYAQQNCDSLFSATKSPTAQTPSIQSSAKKTEVVDLTSFGKALTEGMLLNSDQADIFDIYRKAFFGDPNTNIESSLKTVTNILKKYPELKKEMFTEYHISTVKKIYETPEALT